MLAREKLQTGVIAKVRPKEEDLLPVALYFILAIHLFDSFLSKVLITSSQPLADRSGCKSLSVLSSAAESFASHFCNIFNTDNRERGRSGYRWSDDGT